MKDIYYVKTEKLAMNRTGIIFKGLKNYIFILKTESGKILLPIATTVNGMKHYLESRYFIEIKRKDVDLNEKQKRLCFQYLFKEKNG